METFEEYCDEWAQQIGYKNFGYWWKANKNNVVRIVTILRELANNYGEYFAKISLENQ